MEPTRKLHPLLTAAAVSVIVFSGVGVAGCIALAVSLPWETLASGAALFAAGIAVYAARRFLTAKGRDRD